MIPILIPILVFAASAGAQNADTLNRVVAPPGSDLGLPFSAGVLSGDFLFLSGAIGNQPGTTKVQGDAAAQLRQTLDNLGRVLAAAEMDFSRVVEANLYLSDLRFVDSTIQQIFVERFQADRRPALTTVQADIAIPGAVTEISMIAARPGVEIRRISPEGWPTPPRYSWGLLAGDTVFVSGMASFDPKTGETVSGDARAQTARTMKNVGAVLEAAGLGFGNVVSCRVFLADTRDYGALNEVYPTFFPAAPPARATVRAHLIRPEWKVEVQCTAVKGRDRRAVLPPGAEPRPILSPAIHVGDRLFLSGMVGRGPDGFLPDVSAQTGIVLERLAATLAAAGMSFRDVRDATVFLSDIRYYAAMNEVYRQAVGSPPPARATVGLQLMSPDALVEIQMTASKPAERPASE
jgi:2-iminobutanoate/2-iminopropanoate deaminase